jgi:hypothetical protein
LSHAVQFIFEVCENESEISEVLQTEVTLNNPKVAYTWEMIYNWAACTGRDGNLSGSPLLQKAGLIKFI